MARSNEIQYIRYYSPGSAAEKVELPKIIKQPKPKARKQKAKAPVLRIDGLAAVGIVVAAAMLLCMLLGCVQVCAINRQVQDLEVYVSKLEVQQDQLKSDYEHGYNLEEVRMAAQAMGLVPVEQVQHITVEIPEQETVLELTWWETVLASLKDLFA